MSSVAVDARSQFPYTKCFVAVASGRILLPFSSPDTEQAKGRWEAGSTESIRSIPQFNLKILPKNSKWLKQTASVNSSWKFRLTTF
jgi:hypothetical protein